MSSFRIPALLPASSRIPVLIATLLLAVFLCAPAPADDLDIGSMLPQSEEPAPAAAEPEPAATPAPEKTAPSVKPTPASSAGPVTKAPPTQATNAPPLAGISNFNEFHKKFMELSKGQQLLHCAIPYSVNTVTMDDRTAELKSAVKIYNSREKLKKAAASWNSMYPTSKSLRDLGYIVKIISQSRDRAETGVAQSYESSWIVTYCFELHGNAWMLVSETVNGTGI